MTLKQDRKRTNSKVLPEKLKYKYDRDRYDFSGFDTKNRRNTMPRKIHTGKRGGKYIVYKGQKRYLRK